MKKILVAMLMALLLPMAVAHPADAANHSNCEKYVSLFKKNHLPVSTFKYIAWRESGCNASSFVMTCKTVYPVKYPRGCDPDDSGGGLLGINLRGALGRAWFRLCGITLSNVTSAAKNIECAGKIYHIMGMRPWRK